MPPRDPNLPEGTDSIIDDTAGLNASTSGMGSTGGLGSASGAGSMSGMDDAADIGGPGGNAASLSGGGMGGSSGLGSGTNYSDMSSSGGMGASGSGLGGMGSGTSRSSFASDANSGFDASSGSMGGGSMGGSSSGAAGGIANNSAVQSLKTQASDKVRDAANQGKQKASEAIGNVSQVINDTAQLVDERLGSQYGDYVRRAGDALQGLNSSIQSKEVEELFDDARNLVRQSPTVAISAAAALGFLLVRVIKSGIPADTTSNAYGSSAYSGSGSYGAGSTPRLGTPPRVDNSYDPVA